MEAISPRVDVAFKKIFGVEENKDLLMSLINSIVSVEDQIADLILLNPYTVQNFRRDKLSILDIKAKSKEGKRFNIEIQISDEADYDKRALYYWAKLYTEQLQVSDDYACLSKAIGIHILNFTSILHEQKYHNVFHITEKDSGVIYFKNLELHTLELKKFYPVQERQEMMSKIKSSLDLWMAFLTRHDLLDQGNLPQGVAKQAVSKALDVLEKMNFKPEEREMYEGQLKWLRIEANTLKKYKEEGKEEGLREGEQRGEQRGRTQGKEEASLNIALNLLALGMPADKVSEATGLPIDALEKLNRGK